MIRSRSMSGRRDRQNRAQAQADRLARQRANEAAVIADELEPEHVDLLHDLAVQVTTREGHCSTVGGKSARRNGRRGRRH